MTDSISLAMADSNAATVAKDLASGTVAGVCQLLVGHPFDTIKVKLQAQPAPLPGQPQMYTSAMDAVRKTFAAEGAMGFFAGIGPPLATVALFNAVLFTARGQMEGILKTNPSDDLTISQSFIAGAGAGFAVTFVACPTELVKCRLQAQGSSITKVSRKLMPSCRSKTYRLSVTLLRHTERQMSVPLAIIIVVARGPYINLS